MSITSTEATMTPAQTALSSHLRLLSAGQIQEWVELFAPDGILAFPYAPEGVPQRLQGRDELLAYMVHFPETFDVTFADLVFHETISPQLAIAEFRLTGRVIPTGKPYEQVCISVLFTDENGKITRYNDYWNPLIAIEALTPAGSDE